MTCRPLLGGALISFGLRYRVGEQTIAAAHEPYRTLFTLAALTGARVCGLTWADVRLDDLDDAEVEFGWPVDRKGNRRLAKTDGSARTVPIPLGLAVVIARHKLASREVSLGAFVFATKTGTRSPSAT